MKNGVYETTEYLELFLRNLLLDEMNELHNGSMHISGIFEELNIENAKVDMDLYNVVQIFIFSILGTVKIHMI